MLTKLIEPIETRILSDISFHSGSRSAITAAYGARDLSGKDKIVISGAAGALAGMAQGALGKLSKARNDDVEEVSN